MKGLKTCILGVLVILLLAGIYVNSCRKGSGILGPGY